MAEIKSDVLEKLKCSVCECYLSCAPVYLKTDGNSVCGRCDISSETDVMTRNEPYEELAALIAFPCRYRKQGCQNKLPIRELPQHENGCNFRTIICPVAPSGSCEWVGPRTQLLRHCGAEHPLQVLQHPCTLTHDITSNSLNSYIMKVFHVLFIVQTKVCISARKIYHSVRLLGDSKLTSMYSFEMEINNGDAVIKRQGIVAAQGCLALQEDSALATDINSLLGILGGFNDTSFKITLLKKHVKCEKIVTENVSRTVQGGQFPDTDRATIKVPCRYKGRGCAYGDVPLKVSKHQWYYCRYTTKCELCSKPINETLEEHYRKQHNNITHGAGVEWRSTITPGVLRHHHIITSDIGTLVCTYAYYQSHSLFSFLVRSPLRTSDLSEYICELRLTHPETGHSIQRTLDVTYDEYSDWRTDIRMNTMIEMLVNGKCDITLELKKVP